MRWPHEDGGRDIGVLQEGVLPHEQGRPVQRGLVGKVGRPEDVVHGAHEGQPQAAAARSPAPVQGSPADALSSMGPCELLHSAATLTGHAKRVGHSDRGSPVPSCTLQPHAM